MRNDEEALYIRNSRLASLVVEFIRRKYWSSFSLQAIIIISCRGSTFTVVHEYTGWLFERCWTTIVRSFVVFAGSLWTWRILSIKYWISKLIIRGKPKKRRRRHREKVKLLLNNNNYNNIIIIIICWNLKITISEHRIIIKFRESDKYFNSMILNV